jgi:hypothetical protein
MLEFENLGVSVRTIARRYSDLNPGSKTLVKAIWDPLTGMGRTDSVDNGTPLFMMKLEEELGTHATLELDLLPPLNPQKQVVSHTGVVGRCTNAMI